MTRDIDDMQIMRPDAIRQAMRGVARYHRKRDGVLRIAPNGSSRFLTLWERVALWFGGKP